MQKVEEAILLAARGNTLPLMHLVNRLIRSGCTVEKIVMFAERRYQLPRSIANKAVVELLIN